MPPRRPPPPGARRPPPGAFRPPPGPFRPPPPRVGLGAAVVAGAAVGVGVGVAVSRRRPARVHGVYGRRVVVVRSGPQGRTVRLVCPAGMAPGMVVEVAVDGAPFFVPIPGGVAPGAEFDVVVPLAAAPAYVPAPAPPRFAPRCCVVSDNHGTWTAEKFDTLNQAERVWGGLSLWFASVLFIETRDGDFSAFKEYGTSSAVQRIKARFHDEYKLNLFASREGQRAAFAQPVSAQPVAPPPVVAATPPPAYADPNAPPAPPAYGDPNAPPAYADPNAPPAYADPNAPPAYAPPPATVAAGAVAGGEKSTNPFA